MNSDRPLIIVGAGGLGRETAALAEAIAAKNPSQTPTVAGFVDDNVSLHGTTVLGYPVLGDIEWLNEQSALAYVIAVGRSTTRETLFKRITEPSHHPHSLIHPSVSLHSSVQISPGCLIFQGVVVMLSVSLGRCVIADANATIGHDSILGDFSTVHPGANLSGGITIERSVQVGAGSVILPGKHIGSCATIGAGSVVTKDLPSSCTAVGNPATPINT